MKKQVLSHRRPSFVAWLLVFLMAAIGAITLTLLLVAVTKNYQVGTSGQTLFTTDPLALLMLFLLGVIAILSFLLLVYQTAFGANVKRKYRYLYLDSLDKGKLNDETTPLFTSRAPSQNPSPATSVKSPKTAEAHRFPTLSAIDDAHPSFDELGPTGTSLADLATSFRDYAASELGLFYSLRDVRAFLASLCTSRILLLQGMSGTGKTSLPVAFGKFTQSPAHVVPVQPTWKERSDMLGYYNEFTGRFSETPLLEALYEAGTDDAVRLIVLDEANIAHIEYYFAEFLSLLELPDQQSRLLPVASSGMPGDPKRLVSGMLPLPENVFFVCTANNDDSTFAISDKVYDRASVIDLESRAVPFRSPSASPVRLSAPELVSLGKDAQRRYPLSRRDLALVSGLDSYLRDTFRVSFGNRILRQIGAFVPAYVAAGGEALDGLDYVLARKVVRKLGSANPVYVHEKEPEVARRLESLFGGASAPDCLEAVSRIGQNA
ncbi:MAG: hypothetical protein LKM30_07100 [Bacilli bacterium]|jgi:hypothetical protein|nr:hypothetical protein [Bacilli bacterium]